MTTPRRFYRVTDTGRAELAALLKRARADRRFQNTWPRMAMSTDLEIPSEVYSAADRAYTKIDQVWEATPREIMETAIEVAAPLIVAAELRSLADVLSTRSQEIREEDGRGIRASGMNLAILHLRARADHLEKAAHGV